MCNAWLKSHAMTHHQEGSPNMGNGSREVEYKGGFEYARGKQAKKKLLRQEQLL